MLFRSTLHGGQGGSIVNLSSAAARLGSPGQYLDYAAAKGAIDSFTLGLAKEIAGEGIRVNAIAPGWIETSISRGGREDPVFNEKLMLRLPNKRWAKPAELAGTALFLASPASALITGVTIPVDGGYTSA